jgi:hypothetical protein
MTIVQIKDRIVQRTGEMAGIAISTTALCERD